MRRGFSLIRFLAVNCAMGVMLGWMLLASLLWSDAMGLGGLVSRAEHPVQVVAILAAFFAITFGPAVMGTAVMMLPAPRDSDRR